VTADRARFWHELGVNRLSLGVQSFDDEVLKFLGRCHDAEAARRACEIVGSQFENWGLDLIFGAKPPAAWEGSVAECIRFAPPHVSTYGLTYEERTPFWNQRHEALSDDDALAQYRHAMDAFTAAGYGHYEVSNFARPGFESAHNLIYWRNEAYAGFGPGAVSYLGGVRARNVSRIAAYLLRPGEKEESLVLTSRETKVETLIQHFRTRTGIERAAYHTRFGCEMDEDFGGPLTALIRRELLEEDGGRLSPTRRGYELNNEIGLGLV
jgi:oxygen-independent coproporphyrinogen-3 oxidase